MQDPLLKQQVLLHDQFKYKENPAVADPNLGTDRALSAFAVKGSLSDNWIY